MTVAAFPKILVEAALSRRSCGQAWSPSPDTAVFVCELPAGEGIECFREGAHTCLWCSARGSMMVDVAIVARRVGCTGYGPEPDAVQVTCSSFFPCEGCYYNRRT